MRRRGRLLQTISVTAGGTDGQTFIDFGLPTGARIDKVSVYQKTAGTGTGTFTLVIEDQAGTDLTDSLATVDADAVAGVFHGTLSGKAAFALAHAVGTDIRLAVATVKTGTVTSPVMLFQIYYHP